MSKINVKKFVNFIAYVAVVIIGALLIIGRVFKGEIVSTLNEIANYLSIAVVALTSFYYAKTKRNVVYLIVWVVAIVLIVLSYLI